MQSKITTGLLVFIVAFLANCAWEFFHSYLYIHYRGAPITPTVLLHAALFDAIIITVFLLPAMMRDFSRKYFWSAICIAVLFAIGLERFALETSRWAYTDAMPIVPIIHTGLTPTIQLGFLVWLSGTIVSYAVSRWHSRRMRIVPSA